MTLRAACERPSACPVWHAMHLISQPRPGAMVGEEGKQPAMARSRFGIQILGQVHSGLRAAWSPDTDASLAFAS